MKDKLLLATALALAPCLAQADSLTITDDNSSLTFTRDDAIYNLGNPGDPMQLPRKLEWNVDGRRILIYPSGPSTFIDVGHLHPDAHVLSNQMHAQGPIIGYDTGATTGTVTGGMVYTVDGDASGSGISRLTEKVDIHNKTSAPVNLILTGLGFRPMQASLEVPDLTGLELTGTTMVFYQGSPTATSITDPPFGPVTVLPTVTFSGFNPLRNPSFSLPAGATLTMVTELKVRRPDSPTTPDITAPPDITTPPASDGSAPPTIPPTVPREAIPISTPTTTTQTEPQIEPHKEHHKEHGHKRK